MSSCGNRACSPRTRYSTALYHERGEDVVGNDHAAIVTWKRLGTVFCSVDAKQAQERDDADALRGLSRYEVETYYNTAIKSKDRLVDPATGLVLNIDGVQHDLGGRMFTRMRCVAGVD